MSNEKIKERVEHIRLNYHSFAASVDIPENVQMFAFDVLINCSRTQDLCGIVFPAKDYETADLTLRLYELNQIEKPEQYVGVYYGFKHPLAVLELGLAHIDESPLKILYDKGQYVFTKEPILHVSQTAKTLDESLELVSGLNKDLEKVNQDMKTLLKSKGLKS